MVSIWKKIPGCHKHVQQTPVAKVFSKQNQPSEAARQSWWLPTPQALMQHCSVPCRSPSSCDLIGAHRGICQLSHSCGPKPSSSAHHRPHAKWIAQCTCVAQNPTDSAANPRATQVPCLRHTGETQGSGLGSKIVLGPNPARLQQLHHFFVPCLYFPRCWPEMLEVWFLR